MKKQHSGFKFLKIMNPKIKRQYNLTYRASRKGLQVNGRKKEIAIYFSQITTLINIPQAVTLIREYNFKVIENKQLKLEL